MKRPVPIESGQPEIDRLSEILYDRNSAMSLFYDSEQKCLHITGFPDMDYSECVGILYHVQSNARNLLFKEKTAQGIIIIQLVPRLSERDFDQIERVFARNECDSESERDLQIEYELARSERNFRSAFANQRSSNALRAQLQRIRSHRQSTHGRSNPII